MGIELRYPLVQGRVSVDNGAASAVAIAAPGAGRITRICRGVLTVTVAATGGGGVVSLKDGTTVLNSFPAAALGVYAFEWGDQGFALTTNTALNLVSESGVTTQATAQLTINGYTVG